MNTNYKGEDLMVNEAARKECMDKLIAENGGLRSNKIWTELGTPFVTVCINYMTTELLSNFADVDIEAVKKYTKEKQNPEKYKELIEAGMKFYTYKELNELIANAQKVLVVPFENDTTDVFNPPTRGCYLFTLEAVCKLLMFMTETEKAKEFRNLIIRELQESAVKDTIIKDQHDNMLEMIIDQLENKQELNQTLIIKFLKTLEVSATIGKRGLLGYRDDLERLIKAADTMKKELIKDDPDMEDEYTSTMCFSVTSVKSIIQSKLKDVDRQIEAYKDKVLESIDTTIDTPLTDLLTERLGYKPSTYKVGEYKDMLVGAGIFEKKGYTSKHTKKDGTVEIKTKYNYLPTKDFEWINTAKIGRISNDKRAQDIKFSEYGCKLVNYILDEIEVGNNVSKLTQEQFEDHLVSVS